MVREQKKGNKNKKKKEIKTKKGGIESRTVAEITRILDNLQESCRAATSEFREENSSYRRKRERETRLKEKGETDTYKDDPLWTRDRRVFVTDCQGYCPWFYRKKEEKWGQKLQQKGLFLLQVYNCTSTICLVLVWTN